MGNAIKLTDFCPNASEKAREIFKDRANNLKTLIKIDISQFLNISPVEINNHSAAIIITVDDLTCGIVVSNICDIFSVSTEKMLKKK